MTIATYYEPLNSERIPEDEALIKLWRESWEKCGFNTIVVDHSFAKQHPFHHWVSEHVSKFPTVNHRGYELHCFLRHLAFQLSGAHLYSDYDAIAYAPLAMHKHKPAIHSFMDRHPALYCATPEGFKWFWNHVFGWDDFDDFEGKPHVSDMTIFRKLTMSSSNDCIDWPNPGWKTAPVVHYGNTRLPRKPGEVPRNKAAIILELQKERL
jgi:hypothetical protein